MHAFHLLLNVIVLVRFNRKEAPIVKRRMSTQTSLESCMPVTGRPLGVAAGAGAVSMPPTLPSDGLLRFCPVIPPPCRMLGILGNYENAGPSKAASSQQF